MVVYCSTPTIVRYNVGSKNGEDGLLKSKSSAKVAEIVLAYNIPALCSTSLIYFCWNKKKPSECGDISMPKKKCLEPRSQIETHS